MQTTAAIGAGYWVSGSLQAQQSRSANGRIAFACIGISGKGSSDSQDAGNNGDVVAICDIDDKRLEEVATNRFPKAKRYNDYRKMLEEMRDSIDAVTVSTPDHHHGPASAMAMKLGKHCFCQKPLTRSIWEARRLAEIAAEQKVATIMGNQGTAASQLRETAGIIKSGALGRVTDVHVWTNRPIWPQGISRPAPSDAPAHVHWDLWLGPAPERPYAEGYHPFAWRGWWDFGTGALGDMACHTVNMPFMALNLRDPVSVEAETSGHNKDSYPKSSKITYEFPAIGDRPAVTMYWYDGGRRPEPGLIGDESYEASGCLVIGDKGKLYAPGDYAEKEIKLYGFDKPKVEFERSPGHFEEWVRAIQGGPAAMSNFPDYAGALTETILLGNLAVWSPGKVEWDAATMTPKNKPELEMIVKPKLRAGYDV
jgi:predicted dehydrogenase